MIGQTFTWFANTLSACLPTRLEEEPAIMGVGIALLAVSLVIIRRKHISHAHQALLFEEGTLFPAPRPQFNATERYQDNAFSEKINEEESMSSDALYAPLHLISPMYSDDPHAYLRTLSAKEGIALSEIEKRCNSLRLIIETDAQAPSAACVELLGLAEEILHCASQRRATVELLLDDAEATSLSAAWQLFSQPLQVASSSSSRLKANTQGDWMRTARSLLEEAEMHLRVAALG